MLSRQEPYWNKLSGNISGSTALSWLGAYSWALQQIPLQ